MIFPLVNLTYRRDHKGFSGYCTKSWFSGALEEVNAPKQPIGVSNFVSIFGASEQPNVLYTLVSLCLMSFNQHGTKRKQLLTRRLYLCQNTQTLQLNYIYFSYFSIICKNTRWLSFPMNSFACPSKNLLFAAFCSLSVAKMLFISHFLRDPKITATKCAQCHFGTFPHVCALLHTMKWTVKCCVVLVSFCVTDFIGTYYLDSFTKRIVDHVLPTACCFIEILCAAIIPYGIIFPFTELTASYI